MVQKNGFGFEDDPL